MLFRRGKKISNKTDEESLVCTNTKDISDGVEKACEVKTLDRIQKSNAVFHWDGISYDIKMKDKTRRLLDEVDGWVKPGTLTALMVSDQYCHLFLK